MPSHGKDAWVSTVDEFLELKKYADSPPAYGEGSFRRPATKVIDFIRSLVNDNAFFKTLMIDTGIALGVWYQRDLVQKTNSLCEVCGGHPSKGKSWKSDLSEQCLNETLKERFTSTLKKCHGKEMKDNQHKTAGAYFALVAHFAVAKRLDCKWADKTEQGMLKYLKIAKSSIACAATSKLEYHVCHIYFGSASKADKKDALLRFSAEFDQVKPPIDGGREAWMHPKVHDLEKDILQYGAGTAEKDKAAKPSAAAEHKPN